MAQPKKSILKPLSSIENRRHRDVVPAGNESHQDGTTSGSNSSRGRNGRANETTAPGQRFRRGSSVENGDHQHQRPNRAPRSAASPVVTGRNVTARRDAFHASRVQTRSQSRQPPTRSKSAAPRAHETSTRQRAPRNPSRVTPRRRSSSRTAEALPTRSTRSSYQSNGRQRAARSSSRASRRSPVSRSPVARDRSPRRDRSSQNTRRQAQPSTPFTRSQSIVRNGKADRLRVQFDISTPGTSTAPPNRNNNASGTSHQSLPSKKRSRSSTKFVADDANSQPSTSTAPPPKISRFSRLNSNPSNERTGINGRSSESICCIKDLDTKFSDFIRFCANGCKIEIGGTYMINGGDKVYCEECFNEKKLSKKFKHREWKELKNKNEAKEKMVICQRCRGKRHQCCTLHLQGENFICSSCTTRNDLLTKATLAHYSKNEFEKFMETNLNTALKARLKTPRLKNPLSVVSYKKEMDTPMKDIVPRPLKDDFSLKYGASMKYDVRTVYLFQRREGVDVLVFVMTCHEYKDIGKKSWVVIDYLDSVQHAVGGGINMEAILSYLAWAKQIGFNHAHFFSDPPEKGTDYILHIKPEEQEYKDRANLLSYYNYLLEKGETRGTLVARTLKEELRRQPYTGPTDFLPFEGGLWMNCLEEFHKTIRENCRRRLSTEEYLKELSPLMKTRIRENGKNNFFIDLDVAAKHIDDPDPIKKHKILGDHVKFLLECQNNNWEFGSLRRKYSSVAVIAMMMKAEDQRK